MMTASAFRRWSSAPVVGAVLLASVSCGDVARTGRSPAILVVEVVEAASGADPSKFSATLLSDVLTLVEEQINGKTVLIPTIFNDPARVTFRLALKDPGASAANPLSPTTLNEITVTRYHVEFKRADGRSAQGVDVPYAFDGAFTVTVPATGRVTAGFDLVRHQAKAEPPLANLAYAGGAFQISTIAEITFYGRDQAGNEVKATASMSVHFGDFADPD